MAAIPRTLPVLPMKYTTALVLAATLLVAACETSKPERTDTASPAKSASSLGEADHRRLVNRAEAVRDRTFDTPPALEAVDSPDELPALPRLPDEVAAEQTLLLEQLFGQTPDSALDAPAPPFSRLARYDDEADRVSYVQDAGDAEQREAAIIAALVEALDAEQFDPPPTPTSWDEQLALQTARNATVSFALAQHLLDAHHPDHTADVLAKRPELAGELPVLGDWLESTGSTNSLTGRLDARQQAFVLREGWTLAAALYRSSGWSGVELGRLMPPTRTADVVRADQWMSGEPVGRWTWPGEADEQAAGADGADQTDQTGPTGRAGRAGPAVMSLWLEDVVGPQLARSVHAGYISDAYRYFEADGDASPARLEWLSVWNSPDGAQQVARAFEKRLRKRFEGTDDLAERFVVFQKGLKVGVIIGRGAEDAKRERAQAILEGHKLALEARDGLPTSFVPTRQDRLVEQMQSATLQEREWVDPATDLRLDLSVLGEHWQVQQPDGGPVRWFATHPDGSLLQLTVELDNPLGPDFSSDAYRERLAETFQASLEQAKLDRVAPTDATPTRGLSMRMTGEVDHAPLTLQLWQFTRDDLIVSYSLQAPPQAFAQHHDLARAILDDARTLGATGHTEEADADTSGTIEYEIEE